MRYDMHTHLICVEGGFRHFGRSSHYRSFRHQLCIHCFSFVDAQRKLLCGTVVKHETNEFAHLVHIQLVNQFLLVVMNKNAVVAVVAVVAKLVGIIKGDPFVAR